MNAKQFAMHQKLHDPSKRFAYHETHEPPAIGMFDTTKGRFALLGVLLDGKWEKCAQEIEIKGHVFPDPAGWKEIAEVSIRDVQTLHTEHIADLQRRLLDNSN